MTKKIAVIDGNSFMHRAYHSVPPTMTAQDGTHTNAIFGFFSMLFSFVKKVEPDAIVCAFDAGKPTERIAELKEYKATRKPMDDELREQFPLVKKLLESIDIPVIEVPGWEGDDVLGTLAARGKEQGYFMYLVSGDKDINQLVDDQVSVVSTKRGVSEVIVYTPEKVVEKYGIRPDQFIDYLGFMGDTSDNIPGVPGIGPKTAQKLLAQYGSMEGVYENLDQLKGKQLINIRDNRDIAFLSRKIATIKTDLDFSLDLESLSWPSFDAKSAHDAFMSLSLNKMYHTLLDVARMEVETQVQEMKIREAKTGDEAIAFLDAIKEAKDVVAVDVKEYKGQMSFGDEGLILSLATHEGNALISGDTCIKELACLIKSGAMVIAEDMKRIFHIICPVDSKDNRFLNEKEMYQANIFDISLAEYILDSSKSNPKLEDIVEKHCSLVLPEATDDRQETLIRAQASLLAYEALKSKLEKNDKKDVYGSIDLPLVSVLAILECNGAPIDFATLQELSIETQNEIDSLKKRIYELSNNKEFNIDSPLQLGEVLFEDLKLPHGKKNKRGYSTDAKVLKKISHIHELPKRVLEYREYAKIKSTYIDALPKIAKSYKDLRVHTSFNQTVTATGRLSSSNPNLQNIPVRTDYGRRIRLAFVGYDEDSYFMSADYSQIELRLLAHLSQDEHLIQSFNSGEDFHAATAAKIFDVQVDEVTPAMRSRAKAVNFGIVYGQQSFGLAESLDITLKEAQEMIDRYYSIHTQVRTYLDSLVELAKQQGYVETMYGRKRFVPEIKARNFAQRSFGERTAMNHPMQGSAADIIKIAMRNVAERLVREGLKSKMILQVHDELDFSVPKDEVDTVSALVKEEMEHVIKLDVPLIVDVSYAKTWAEAH